MAEDLPAVRGKIQQYLTHNFDDVNIDRTVTIRYATVQPASSYKPGRMMMPIGRPSTSSFPCSSR